MPIISKQAQSERLSQFQAYDPDTMAESSFGEVFAASLGTVIDEELSISQALNNEGFRQRKKVVDELILSGDIQNYERYRTKGGRMRQLDYDRIAQDLGREDIKTDEQLHQERAEVLRQRREYSEDVVSRGSGAAQFLGAMNGYLLDPVNILTVGIAAPATAGKAVTTIGRVALATRNAAIIDGVTELGIQAFVYNHKQDIDSPYSTRDFLANVGMAATGAGLLGGTTEGLAGWFKSVRKVADQLPETAEIKTAKEYLDGHIEMLEAIHAERKANQIEDPRLLEIYDSMLQSNYNDYEQAVKAGVDLLQSDIDAAKKSNETILQYLSKKGGLSREDFLSEGVDPEYFKGKAKVFGKPIFPRQGGLSADDVAELLNQEGYRVDANEALEIVRDALDNDVLLNVDARANLELLKKDMRLLEAANNNRYLDKIFKGARETDLEQDLKFYEELEQRRAEYSQPPTTAESYKIPDQPEAQPKPPPASATAREREVMKAAGIDSSFDAEYAKFQALDDAPIIQGENMVDAKAIVDGFDQELKGLDEVLTCAYAPPPSKASKFTKAFVDKFNG